jgi:hypothetical protein
MRDVRGRERRLVGRDGAATVPRRHRHLDREVPRRPLLSRQERQTAIDRR